MTSRRLKRLKLTTSFFVILERGAVFEVIDGLPDGTKILAVQHDIVRNCVWLLLENEKFEEVGEGKEIPEHEPVGVRVLN